MEHIVYGISLVLSRKDSVRVFLGTSILFLLLLIYIQNNQAALTALSFDTLPLYKRILLALTTLFDVRNTFTASALILATLGSLLGGMNIALAYTYMRVRGNLLIRSGLYSGLGLLFALLGVGCAACGTALLAVILSFLGLSAMLHTLPYQGQEIGYIGIIFLCMATYSLSLRLKAPATC